MLHNLVQHFLQAASQVWIARGEFLPLVGTAAKVVELRLELVARLNVSLPSFGVAMTGGDILPTSHAEVNAAIVGHRNNEVAIAVRFAE